MSELDFARPTALASGVVANLFNNDMALSLASCNQQGSGTFSWLLQFDTVGMTLTTGGARPVMDPTLGYSFDIETISGLSVGPLGYSGVSLDASGNFSASTPGMELLLPIFLDAAGTSSIVLPLHELRFTMGTLTSNNDCIGTYNAAGLDPTNSCQPSGTTPAFIDGATLDGFMYSSRPTPSSSRASTSHCAAS
jgi:hypothetical protein